MPKTPKHPPPPARFSCFRHPPRTPPSPHIPSSPRPSQTCPSTLPTHLRPPRSELESQLRCCCSSKQNVHSAADAPSTRDPFPPLFVLLLSLSLFLSAFPSLPSLFFQTPPPPQSHTHTHTHILSQLILPVPCHQNCPSNPPPAPFPFPIPRLAEVKSKAADRLGVKQQPPHPPSPPPHTHTPVVKNGAALRFSVNSSFFFHLQPIIPPIPPSEPRTTDCCGRQDCEKACWSLSGNHSKQPTPTLHTPQAKRNPLCHAQPDSPFLPPAPPHPIRPRTRRDIGLYLDLSKTGADYCRSSNPN